MALSETYRVARRMGLLVFVARSIAERNQFRSPIPESDLVRRYEESFPALERALSQYRKECVRPSTGLDHQSGLSNPRSSSNLEKVLRVLSSMRFCQKTTKQGSRSYQPSPATLALDALSRHLGVSMTEFEFPVGIKGLLLNQLFKTDIELTLSIWLAVNASGTVGISSITRDFLREFTKIAIDLTTLGLEAREGFADPRSFLRSSRRIENFQRNLKLIEKGMPVSGGLLHVVEPRLNWLLDLDALDSSYYCSTGRLRVFPEVMPAHPKTWEDVRSLWRKLIGSALAQAARIRGPSTTGVVSFVTPNSLPSDRIDTVFRLSVRLLSEYFPGLIPIESARTLAWSLMANEGEIVQMDTPELEDRFIPVTYRDWKSGGFVDPRAVESRGKESTPTEYDVFISYHHSDRSWVENLAHRIEQESMDGRPIRVFFDQWDIRPGENVVRRLERAVSRSRFVAVVLSPEMVDAEWPTFEWTMAVYDDPSAKRGKVLPVLVRNCEIPPALRIRNILDFRKPELFDISYARLLAVLKNGDLERRPTVIPKQEQIVQSGLVPPIMNFAEQVPEQLVSNLFPVEKYPDFVWSAKTDVNRLGYVYDQLRRILPSGALPTFTIKEGFLVSFWDPTDERYPFRALVSEGGFASPRKEETYQWIDNEIKRPWLLELLNRALWNHCEHLGLFRDRVHGRVYFPPDKGDSERVIEWLSGKRKSRRTVTRQLPGRDGPIWAHQSVRLGFVIIGGKLFLRMEPGWTFTQDGLTPIPSNRLASISASWMHIEFNPALFSHLRFWTFILSEGRDRLVLSADKSSITIGTTPATTETQVGIFGDTLSVDRMYEVAEEIPEVSDIPGRH